MFRNDNLLTLPAENYAYCKIWDRDRDNYCVKTRRFYGNHSYHIVIKESTFTSKAVKTKELCILRGKS